jgi:hypothetical protein
MSGEIITYQDEQSGLQLMRAPEVVLEEARQSAAVLKDVLDKKEKKVMMNGEQYLEFEDWSMLGRFYGLSVKIASTEFLEYGTVQGFLARAVVLDRNGQEVSAAEAMCLNDEDKWSTRSKYEWRDGVKIKVGDERVPMFQLRSMAQTRAAAKAFRNVLSWVVVLAGYKPTPAEEMTGSESSGQRSNTAPTGGPLTIKDVKIVTGGKEGNTWKRYDIIDSNGTKHSTFSDSHGENALKFMASGVIVKISSKKGKYGQELQALVADETQEASARPAASETSQPARDPASEELQKKIMDAMDKVVQFPPWMSAEEALHQFSEEEKGGKKMSARDFSHLFTSTKWAQATLVKMQAFIIEAEAGGGDHGK